MPEERDIFCVGIDEGRDVFVVCAASKAMSAVPYWDTDRMNKIDSDVIFSNLNRRCKGRGLRYDGLLFDESSLSDYPTLWLGYFGDRR